MTETEITNRKIKPFLVETYAARPTKYHGDVYSEAGVADLLVCMGVDDLRGIFAAFEVKKPGEKPRANQLVFLESIKKAGGIAGVIYTDTFKEDIHKIITQYRLTRG